MVLIQWSGAVLAALASAARRHSLLIVEIDLACKTLVIPAKRRSRAEPGPIGRTIVEHGPALILLLFLDAAPFHHPATPTQ